MSEIDTLFLIQCPFARIDQLIKELTHLVSAQDELVLFEDAVFAVPALHTLTCQQITVLESDSYLIANMQQQPIESITYAQLAKKIAHAKKVLTWK